ncbi:MAG: replication initiator protein A [Ruminococcus sp.]|nr:replication initiator protein A [Ruminococcus sp.]
MADYGYFNINNMNRRQPRFFKLYKYFLLDDSFADLSSEAKIAYSLFENRHQSSVGNPSYKDEKGFFIFFSRQEIIDSMNCSEHKAAAIMKELLNFGLVERSAKLGGFSGKKDSAQYKLYVKDYVDFIKSKAKKERTGEYDSTKTRDFIMIPFSLFDSDKEFFILPINVKITYAMLLNLSLISFDNESYHDEDGNIFVKMSIKDLQTVFGGEKRCSKSSAIRYFDKLNEADLIEKKHIGQEFRIYVKNIFAGSVKTDITDGVKTDITDGVKTDITGGVKIDITDGVKTDTSPCIIRKNNYTSITRQEKRQLELDSKLQPSDGMTRSAYRKELYERFDIEGYKDLLEVLTKDDALISKRLTVYKALINAIVWARFTAVTLNISGDDITSSDFITAIDSLTDSELERITDWIVEYNVDYNVNYLLTALYDEAVVMV